jgi:CubicO group peptidase (beta-lactamase class C family)
MRSDPGHLRGAFQLSRAGALAAHGAAGPAGPATGGSCRLDSRFQAGSISKQVVAASIMILSERGRLRLEDPVSRWWSPAPPDWEEMTVGHLLSHSSGLGAWQDIPEFEITDPPPPDGILEQAARLPLGSRPGTRWEYSGVGYLLAAAIVEAASNETYGAFVTDNIFDPLGMTASSSGVAPDPSGVAMGHRDGEPTPLVAGLTALPGTGDLWTTVADLVRYAEAVSAGELLSARSLESMRRPHATIQQPAAPGETILAAAYGHGLFIGSIAGQPAWFHPGDNPGYRSFLAWIPGTEITLAVLSNDESIVLDDLVPRLISLHHS